MSTFGLGELLQAAIRHHQAGRLPQAEALYRQILQRNPKHADALHLLGVIAHRAGRNHDNDDAAVDLIRRAIALKPDFPEAYNNLGNALSAQGKFDEAIAAYRQAIALNANFYAAYGNLGNILKHVGQLEDAVVAYRQAIALRPDDPDAYSNLGVALKEKGQPHKAIAACRQAIALRPNYCEAYSNLGNALVDTGQLDEAIAAYRRAVALKDDYPEVHNNLGAALKQKGQLDEAIAAYQRAIALKPDAAEFHFNLGNAFVDKVQLNEGIDAYRQATALRPEYAEAYSNLGNALVDSGQLDDGIAAYRQALTLKPASPEGHSNLLFALNYHPGYSADAIAQEAERWNVQHAQPLAHSIRPHSNDRAPDRRLKIGYVSPDLRDHAVAQFLLPLLCAHDHQHFEIVAYSQVRAPDAVTQQLRSHAHTWRSIVSLSDEQAAELIRQDGIDILVDLAGHTANSRLLIFARKPAPVQVSYLGYPATTGLRKIDYRLTDIYADPPEQAELAQRHYSERLVRLSPTAWCCQMPEVSPANVRQEGPLTFGCFNNFAKVSEPILRSWARIVQAVPGSRLLLKSAGLGSESVRQRVRQVLHEEGIGPERLELLGHKPTHGDHLASYRDMDIALDTFPYHGTTTTCEALWMGVPVISLAGATHVSGVGVSLLSNLGLAELVARSEVQYVQIAVKLANDLPRLAELRSTLRQRMEQSPLMDAQRFARSVEAAYREMWRKWCASEEAMIRPPAP